MRLLIKKIENMKKQIAGIQFFTLIFCACTINNSAVVATRYTIKSNEKSFCLPGNGNLCKTPSRTMVMQGTDKLLKQFLKFLYKRSRNFILSLNMLVRYIIGDLSSCFIISNFNTSTSLLGTSFWKQSV